MKKYITIFIALSMSVSLMGGQLTTDLGNQVVCRQFSSSWLLNENATARGFGQQWSTRAPRPNVEVGFLEQLGIGFVIGSKANYFNYKNNIFYKKHIETGNIYSDGYSEVNNWFHLEIMTPIINVMYESTFPIWNTFPSSPRYSQTHFDFFGSFLALARTDLNPVMEGLLFILAPYTNHSRMSTRDYTKNTWDFQFAFIFNYRMTTETFLVENANPYRIKSRRFYYLGMTYYLQYLQGLNRFIHLLSVSHGAEYTSPFGLKLLPVLPFIDMYRGTFITEEYIHNQWYERSREKTRLNMEIGIMYVNEYQIRNTNLILQPFFKWILYSSRYVKNADGTYNGYQIQESSIEASITLQYVF